MRHNHKTIHNCHATIQIPYISEQIVNSKEHTRNRLMCISCSGFSCSKNNASQKDIQKLVQEIQQAFNEQTNQLKSEIAKLTSLHNEKIKVKDSEITSLEKRNQKLEVSLKQEKQRNKKIQIELDKVQKEKELIFKAKIAQAHRVEKLYKTEISDLRNILAQKIQQIQQYRFRLKQTNALNQESFIKNDNAFRSISQDLEKQIKLNYQLKTQNQFLITQQTKKQKDLMNIILNKEEQLKLIETQCKQLKDQLIIKQKANQFLLLQKDILEKKLAQSQNINIITQEKLKNNLSHNQTLTSNMNKINSQLTRLKNQKYTAQQIILQKHNQVNNCRNQIGQLINKNRIIHKPIRVVQFCQQCNNQYLKKSRQSSLSKEKKYDTVPHTYENNDYVISKQPQQQSKASNDQHD